MSAPPNPFVYTKTHKRYHTWDHYLKQTYGAKVAKITVNGVFNCPNRDGTVATGSCFFCSDRGSGDFAGDAWKDLLVQYDEQKAKVLAKWPHTTRFMAYFQANTNTHDAVANLKRRFEPFAEKREVVAIAVGTRPDCLPPAVLDYLADLNRRKPLWVEMGLQTVHDRTAAFFNRAYPTALCWEKIAALRARHINVAIHLINSLPGDTPAMMVESVRQVCAHDIQSLKIHMLHVVKNSPWGLRYAASQWQAIMDRDAYVATVAEQLKWIPARVAIQRLTGDPDKRQLLTPAWTLDKSAVIKAIDARLAGEGAWQGMAIEPRSEYESSIIAAAGRRLKPQAAALCAGVQSKTVVAYIASRARRLHQGGLDWIKNAGVLPTSLDYALVEAAGSGALLAGAQAVLPKMKRRGKLLLAYAGGIDEEVKPLVAWCRQNRLAVQKKGPLKDGPRTVFVIEVKN